MDYKFSIHFCLPGYYIAQTFVGSPMIWRWLEPCTGLDCHLWGF